MPPSALFEQAAGITPQIRGIGGHRRRLETTIRSDRESKPQKDRLDRGGTLALAGRVRRPVASRALFIFFNFFIFLFFLKLPGRALQVLVLFSKWSVLADSLLCGPDLKM